MANAESQVQNSSRSFALVVGQESAEDLVRRARGGSRTALERLVVVHLDPHLRRASRTLVRGRGSYDAEDVLQEARVRMLAGDVVTRFDPARGSLESWSWGVVRFVARTWERNESSRGRKLEGAAAEQAQMERDRRDDRPVEELLDARRALARRRARVEDQLRAVTPRQRQALRLVDVEGLTIEEAAAVMGCTAAAVNSLLGHGRTRVRQRCGKWSADRGSGRAERLALMP